MDDVHHDLLDDYEGALASHLSGVGGETALVRAYELGRKAVAAGLGVLELVDLHQTAVGNVFDLVAWNGSPSDAVRIVDRFLQEALSAFEVTHLGFKEATELVLHSLQFEAVVCHELKTPLTSILASAGLLQELVEEKGDDDSPEAKLTANILDASAKLKERTDDLMDIVAFRAGSLTLRMDRMAIGPVVRSACQRMELTVASVGMALHVDVPEDLPTMMGDRGRLEQVVTNLIDNAIKYGADGKEIEVTARQAEGGAVIEVHDHGRGIPLRDQARLFESSFRGKGSAKSVPGLGIGLALCQTIVDAHGGTISVESEEGKGSTFRVMLPIGDTRPMKRSSR